MIKIVLVFTFSLVALIVNAADKPVTKTIPASDPLFLGSVLAETWDVRQSATQGYIDCMMSLSDVDLTVVITKSGSVTLNFDVSIYAPNQSATAGPMWKFKVDEYPPSDRIVIGPAVRTISTPSLPPGSHRVRFIQSANMSSPRWFVHDPQLSRVTGVTLPEGAHLEKSARPTAWFLPVTDSIGEGAVNMNATTATWRAPSSAYTDSTNAWPALVAEMLHKSVAGYLISGIGIIRAGTGVPYGAINSQDPTGANDAWDHIFAGVPRPFNTAPDFIILCVGSNEWATDPHTVGHADPTDPSSSDSGFQANVEIFFSRVRAHPQLTITPIYVGVPFGGYKRTSLRKAVEHYRAAHPGEIHIELFDLAFGSPGLTTTDGIDEITLFGGLTKNRPDDKDTIPSPQSSDRTHPYGIATPTIGSVNAHEQIAQVTAPRLLAMLKGGPAPKTGDLEIGPFQLKRENGIAHFTVTPATGGSAPYFYQFQKSVDNGRTWIALGQPIESMQTTLQPVEVSDSNPTRDALYRLQVTDSADPEASAHTATVSDSAPR
jgi:hypothetical protein